jgi:multimeric flavodoxin WrbA
MMEDELKQFKYIVAAVDRINAVREGAGMSGLVRSGRTKKIIALSCGKKNGFCETYAKAAAIGAAEFGMETEIIRASELTVKPCGACYACNAPLLSSSPKLPKCPLKDDVSWLMEKTVVEDAALIVAVPVYHLLSNGLLLTLCQRMHPTMFTHMEMFQARKVAGIISVGGGMDGWTSLGMLIPQIWLQHFSVVVDQLQVEMRYLDVDWFERAKQLGRNVAKAMTLPPEQVKYVGEESVFACPVCHSDVLQMPDQKPRPSCPGESRYKPSHIVCPICWVHGTLTLDGDRLSVKWDEWDIKHPRFSKYGDFEHQDVIIRNLTPGCDEYLDMDQTLAPIKEYASYGKFIKP